MGRKVLHMGPGELRLWVEACLCLNPLKVWLCLGLGLGLGLGWSRLGERLPGLWSVLSLVLLLL